MVVLSVNTWCRFYLDIFFVCVLILSMSIVGKKICFYPTGLCFCSFEEKPPQKKCIILVESSSWPSICTKFFFFHKWVNICLQKPDVLLAYVTLVYSACVGRLQDKGQILKECFIFLPILSPHMLGFCPWKSLIFAPEQIATQSEGDILLSWQKRKETILAPISLLFMHLWRFYL